MIAIDTIVSIKSGDEYGGKYTGKLGIVKRFTDDRVGVEFAGLKNHASKYGLFWFNKENVTPSLFDTPLIEMSEKNRSDYCRGHLSDGQIHSDDCGSDG